MPYFPGPILIAYQLIVPGSRWARGCADFRNSSTSCSLPGLDSSCAQIASFPIAFPSCRSDAWCTCLVTEYLAPVWSSLRRLLCRIIASPTVEGRASSAVHDTIASHDPSQMLDCIGGREDG